MDKVEYLLDGDLIVVDDFYRNLEAVRTHALQLDYDPPSPGSHYPGIQSTRPMVSAGLENTFSKLAGVPLVPAQGAVFGKLRVGLEQQIGDIAVHIDHVAWSAIVYLNNPPANQFSGLSVVRHRDLPQLKVNAKLLDQLDLADRTEFDRRWVRPHSADMTKWERVETISCRANRLVLFRSGTYCHVIENLFGHDLQTGRMTHSFFMNEAI